LDQRWLLEAGRRSYLCEDLINTAHTLAQKMRVRPNKTIPANKALVSILVDMATEALNSNAQGA
jgi:hypothetical protein